MKEGKRLQGTNVLKKKKIVVEGREMAGFRPEFDSHHYQGSGLCFFCLYGLLRLDYDLIGVTDQQQSRSPT